MALDIATFAPTALTRLVDEARGIASHELFRVFRKVAGVKPTHTREDSKRSRYRSKYIERSGQKEERAIGIVAGRIEGRRVVRQEGRADGGSGREREG